jgi:hypothetical protein
MANDNQWYKPTTGDVVFGVEAIKHKVTKEVTVFGKKGQIWENTTESFKVLLYGKNRRVNNQIAAMVGAELPSLSKTEEYLLTVPKALINDVKKLILVPSEVGRQVTLAGKFDQNKHC